MGKTSEFQVGDTVRLKSGGPLMTVEAIQYDEDDAILCVWFAENEKKSDEFIPETLVKDDGLPSS
jgi:uncharacterized protein YodC (DUF2158 family)